MLKNNKGFTLIKLLIIIAIIGILLLVIFSSIKPKKCKEDNTLKGCSQYIETTLEETETIEKIKAERYKSCLKWASYEDIANCDLLLPKQEEDLY